jgi:hypothetical protein
MTAVWQGDGRGIGRDMRPPVPQRAAPTAAEAPRAADLDTWLHGQDAPRTIPAAPVPRDRAVSLGLGRCPAWVANPPGTRVVRSACGAQFTGDQRPGREQLDPLHALLGPGVFDDPEPERASAVPDVVLAADRDGLHGIEVLARALKRRPRTMRDWEKHGILPPAAHHSAGNAKPRSGKGVFGDGAGGQRRLYTTAEIDAAAQIARDEGLLLQTAPGKRPERVNVSDTQFAHRVLEAWERLREAEAGR